MLVSIYLARLNKSFHVSFLGTMADKSVKRDRWWRKRLSESRNKKMLDGKRMKISAIVEGTSCSTTEDSRNPQEQNSIENQVLQITEDDEGQDMSELDTFGENNTEGDLNTTEAILQQLAEEADDDDDYEFDAQASRSCFVDWMSHQSPENFRMTILLVADILLAASIPLRPAATVIGNYLEISE